MGFISEYADAIDRHTNCPTGPAHQTSVTVLSVNGPSTARNPS
ncbi:hypothetical protein ACIGXM_26580 [Kitasatospora sp. NPDC052896]